MILLSLWLVISIKPLVVLNCMYLAAIQIIYYELICINAILLDVYLLLENNMVEINLCYNLKHSNRFFMNNLTLTSTIMWL